MNKAAHQKRDGAGPSVLRFKARLFRHPGTAEGTMNGHPFRAALEPSASGGHSLRVNKAMCNGAGAGAGDTVKLAILGPEPEPAVPADLRLSFAASREAKTLWKDLTSNGRRDWIRWIVSAKKPETRARRVRRTVEQLSSGKRRPCCVNVYEFMLRRVQE
jgi:Bacteriocin-protection, YdeI or OmpD-Associated/Domain of unknown function (DUF1905)